MKDWLARMTHISFSMAGDVTATGLMGHGLHFIDNTTITGS